MAQARYKELGFVNTRDMFAKAYKGGYAVPAFNFVALEQMLAIIDACVATDSPFIMQASANVRKMLGAPIVRHMAAGGMELVQQSGKKIPVALHLDHGETYEDCVGCINDGFSSVMIDGSAHPFTKNIQITAKVVEYAHRYDITVEGELGVLSGVEEGTAHAESRFTDPTMVEEFVKSTGVDSLAISIGTSHGVVKVKVAPGEAPPPLRFDILDEVSRRLPGFPIVLHGASAIPAKHVAMINEFGGKLTEAQGIDEEQVRRAVKSSVCKVNVASDGWIAMVAATRKALAQNPQTIDPRTFLKASRKEMSEVYMHKTCDVLGSAGKAS
jgi:fructose-bisphosphate aldolase class II